jgi:hypothetical protein
VRLPTGSGPLTRPRFRRFWTAQTVSVLGDQVSLLALPLTAMLTLHLTAAGMGLLTAAGYAPTSCSRSWPAAGSTARRGAG